MRNRWKRAFFILLGINLIIIVALFFIIINLVPHGAQLNAKNWSSPPISQSPMFTVNGNKDELTTLINEELQKELKGNLDASILLNDQVVIQGHITILGVPIPYKMSLEPKVENNGETVVLNETSVTVGRFNLPVAQVLMFIQQGASFPNWVVVQPDKKRLDVHLSGFVIRDQFTIRAKTIDLKNNQLIFNIYRTPTAH